jgi:2-polyprenyl-3-methyl-5-hydroxy-6-metoxy-1,4-benzoquinol methylase
MNPSYCPICASKTSLFYQGLYDDRYGCPGLFDLYSCVECGHKHLKSKFSEEQLASLYKTYYPRVTFNIKNILPLNRRRGFRAWFDGDNSFAYRWVPRNVRILDIGCGFGETLGYHKERGCEVFGVETDENVQLVADKFSCKFNSGLFNHSHYAADYFDYVTLDQVFEHFVQPIESMIAVAKILKKNGVAVICTPNSEGWGRKIFGKTWINWHTPYHLHLFSAESMKQLTEMTGFRLERHMTITSSNWIYYQMCGLLFNPLPGEPSEFWSSKSPRSLYKKLLLKCVKLIHYLKLTHPITRLFDSMNIGDNHIFLLRKE